MSPLLAPYIRAIESEAADELQKLGAGQFTGDGGAKAMVMYRKGLLRAAEILKQRRKGDDDNDQEDL